MTLEELQNFHTVRREKSVTVTIEKYATPMLWLDTSVILDFAKMDKRENIERVRGKRLARLRTTVQSAIRRERLVCPEADQSVEFEGLKINAEAQRVSRELSRGAHCIPHAGVKDRQVAHGLRAYLAMADTIHIPSAEHFYRDPLEVVQAAKRNRFIVESDIPKPAEWIDKAKADKRATQVAFEKLRTMYTSQRQSFYDQLELERVGESSVMVEMVANYQESLRCGKQNFWGYMSVEGFLKYIAEWSTMGGPSDTFEVGLSALYSYMRSAYYWELPIQDVSCRLSADLMVNNFAIKSGDSHDIQHLSVAIPVAHFVVADKAMVDRCERLGIDKKWNTKLFTTRTLDSLSDEIEAL